jgi:transcriptional regulator with XRE-family HTH domain
MRLRDVREGQGLSQERLGEIAEVDRKTIKRIENGMCSPRMGNVFHIADALEISVGELFNSCEVLRKEEDHVLHGLSADSPFLAAEPKLRKPGLYGLYGRTTGCSGFGEIFQCSFGTPVLPRGVSLAVSAWTPVTCSPAINASRLCAACAP